MVDSCTRPAALAAASLTALACLGCAVPAQAREGLDLAAVYTADVSATVSGGADREVRYLDNLELSLDADLGKLIGANGAALHAAVLNNLGARPNDAAGTLEGVNNIEVGRAAVRLFELWGEQSLGPASLRLGLYDLNSEFNATESAGLLIAPPFGIGSEFAASGPAGPSIFPSSALTARLRTQFGASKTYAQIAVLNARAQTFGDPGGVDLSFGDGLLVAGEIGRGEKLRLSLGGWTYTRARDSLSALDANGDPLRKRPAGLYAMVEAKLAEGGRRAVTAFARGGVAHGRTQPFVNSAQAGLLVTPAILGRDNSAFSVGLHQATTSDDFRQAAIAAGDLGWRREQAIEVTFADQLVPHFTLQPDLQVIRQSGDDLDSRTAVQTTLRMQLAF